MSKHKTTVADVDAPPLNYVRFCGMAARLAATSSHWAADVAQSIDWETDAGNDLMPRATMNRYLSDMRRLLDHMDKQVLL